MKRKSLMFLASMAMFVTVLSGCGASEGSNTTQTGTESSEEQTSESDSSEDITELTVWGWDASFNGLALEEADALYEEANINFVEMAKADCLQKLHTVLASGVTEDLPDIVIISDLAAQGYLESYPGSFYPMEDVIAYDDFANYKREMVSYDGVGYGIPFDTGVAGLFYRTDYIEEAGYTDEDMQDLTWTEYLELGAKLKENGRLLQTYNPNDISEFQIMLQSADSWYTDDNGEPNFVDNDALEESINIFKQLNESDFVKVTSDWTGFAGAINGGEVACVIRGSWITATIKGGTDQSGLWKLAPIPKLSVDDATNKSNQGGSSWYVLANSKNTEAAADFMAKTFGESTELYNTLLESNNIMATYLPASDVAAYDKEDEFFSNMKVNQTLSSWIPEIPAVNTGAYTAEAQAAILAVMPDILGGSEIDSSLQQAEDQFNQTVQ
ncbi:MAG: ABC transporter substrate-binding protein [Lachnospiraceae bacterium]